jgi:hypothetical protein
MQMKKLLMLSSVALLGCAMAWAQDPAAYGQSGTGHGSTDPQASMKAQNGGMVQGCLGGSDGNYTLTQDSTGTVYKLNADDSKLKDHVGHEVAISGTAKTDNSALSASSGSTTATGSSSGSMGGSSIDVTHVKMVSSTCTK